MVQLLEHYDPLVGAYFRENHILTLLLCQFLTEIGSQRQVSAGFVSARRKDQGFAFLKMTFAWIWAEHAFFAQTLINLFQEYSVLVYLCFREWTFKMKI